MNKTLSMIVGSLLMIPALGQAAENHKPVSQWTCEDFLATDTTFQPTVVGFAEGSSLMFVTAYLMMGGMFVVKHFLDSRDAVSAAAPVSES